jgi:hypothetical protein
MGISRLPWAGTTVRPSIAGDLGNGEAPSTPLSHARYIGWRRAQGRGSRTIATACHAVARAAVAHKVLLPRAHRLAWDARRRLRRRQCHP